MGAVFQHGQPVAFIDFDFAAPSAVLEDIGDLGWTWCVPSHPARGPAGFQAAHLKIPADAYGREPKDRAALTSDARAASPQYLVLERAYELLRRSSNERCQNSGAHRLDPA
jgi:hypothetical protein